MDIKGKKISIIGAERSGIAAALLAQRQKAAPFVSDFNDSEKTRKSVERLDEAGIPYETGGHTARVYDCDIMVTSPGVPSDAPVLVKAAEKGIEVISEIEFAHRFVQGNVIAITGTNGKTTTVSLTHHLFEKAGKRVFLGGNVGYAYSAFADETEPDDITVLEISSFQLDFIKDFKPDVSVILNITPDHLNRYDNKFENYIASKLRIFENQGTGDFYVYNADDKILPEKATDLPAEVYHYEFSLNGEVEQGAFLKDNVLYFRKYEAEHEEICRVDELSLKGEHNISNILAVITIAKIYDLDKEIIKAALADFPGVEHRLEFVREINGIKFVNDSKATNLDSVWYALRSFEEPLYLILGGRDKGNDYSGILEPVKKHVKKIYALGESKDKVYEYFKNIVKTEKKETLEECVRAGLKDAEPGSVVLLSPACASFDMFDSYEHRGKVFKEIVSGI